DDKTVAALQIAAVVGQQFDLDVLALATEHDVGALVNLLEPAGRARILVESTVPGRFAFAHALVAGSLYEDLGVTRQQLLHRRGGERIEKAPEVDRGGYLGERAPHWWGAGAPQRAIDSARQAGDAALSGLAPLDAIRWYTQALELVGDSRSAL